MQKTVLLLAQPLTTFVPSLSWQLIVFQGKTILHTHIQQQLFSHRSADSAKFAWCKTRSWMRGGAVGRTFDDAQATAGSRATLTVASPRA